PLLKSSTKTCRSCWNENDTWVCLEFEWELSAKASPPITAANIAERAENFSRIVEVRACKVEFTKLLTYSFSKIKKERAEWFIEPVVLLPFGHDFSFQNASVQF